MLLTKTTATQNEVALGYFRVRGLYFLAVVFFGDYSYRKKKCLRNKYISPIININRYLILSNISYLIHEGVTRDKLFHAFSISVIHFNNL